MKFRLDFVTNSSSSSYICDVCGQDASGWDLSLTDAEMYECCGGHTFCEGHVVKAITTATLYRECMEDNVKQAEKEKSKDKQNKWIIESGETAVKELERIKDMPDEDLEGDVDAEDFESDGEYRYALPTAFCPLCSFEKLDSKLALKYLMKTSGKTAEELLKTLKNDFETFTAFEEFCNEDKN